MSGIITRTVHYEYDQRPEYKRFRFHDWNTVTTNIGTMMEPSQMVPRPHEGGQLSWDDAAVKIDNLQNLDGNKPHKLSGGPDMVIGYNLMPREGR